MNAAAPAPASSRPNLVGPSSEGAPDARKPKTIQGLLEDPNTKAKFGQILPRHLNPERMLRTMAMAVYKTPDLAKCHPITLLGAMMACASLGLEPNTPLGHCYLIPFKNTKKSKDPDTGQWTEEVVYEVQLIIGYKGYIDLARRSGTLVSIHADVVYEGDEFSFEYGSNQHIRHVPKGSREGRNPIWAYCYAKLTDGEAFEVKPIEEVYRIRDGAQGYQFALAAKKDAESNERKAWRLKTWDTCPWVKHFHEMAAKTMVRSTSKWLSMSIEFANAATLDGMSETGSANFAAFADDSTGALMDASVAQIEHRPEMEMPPMRDEDKADPEPARRTRKAKPDAEHSSHDQEEAKGAESASARQDAKQHVTQPSNPAGNSVSAMFPEE